MPQHLPERPCLPYADRVKTLAGNGIFAGVSLLLCAAALALAAHGDVEHQSFKAFYCGGAAVREHHDPYRVEPLRSCERTLERASMPEGYVEPAPLPGYALAPFALLSDLSPRRAAELFALLLAVASILCARALSSVIPGNAAAILLALTPLTLLNVAYGEVPPLATIAIVASGFFLARERWSAAGICAVCALIQPNVGAATVLAVFLLAPRSRLAVVAAAVVLAAISLGSLGFAGNLEYFRDVLPAMAHAEIVAADQFSLARLLYVAGLPERAALLLGELWFLVTVATGILLSRRLLALTHRREFIALLPAATVLFFGVYLHDVQILIALPAALAVASIAPRGPARIFATAGVALLAAVWTQPARSLIVALDAVGVAGAVFAVRNGAFAPRAILAGSVSCAVVALMLTVQHFAHPLTGSAIVTSPFSALPNELSPASWARYLRATPALMRPEFAAQAAAWFGLFGMLVGASARPVTPARS